MRYFSMLIFRRLFSCELGFIFSVADLSKFLWMFQNPQRWVERIKTLDLICATERILKREFTAFLMFSRLSPEMSPDAGHCHLQQTFKEINMKLPAQLVPVSCDRRQWIAALWALCGPKAAESPASAFLDGPGWAPKPGESVGRSLEGAFARVEHHTEVWSWICSGIKVPTSWKEFFPIRRRIPFGWGDQSHSRSPETLDKEFE